MSESSWNKGLDDAACGVPPQPDGDFDYQEGYAFADTRHENYQEPPQQEPPEPDDSMIGIAPMIPSAVFGFPVVVTKHYDRETNQTTWDIDDQNEISISRDWDSEEQAKYIATAINYFDKLRVLARRISNLDAKLFTPVLLSSDAKELLDEIWAAL